MKPPRSARRSRSTSRWPSPFSQWAARAAGCWRGTGSSRSPSTRDGPRNRHPFRASRSAPARRSTTSRTLPPRNGVAPVFSLMPTPGDVDVVMAAELMEAGRSVLRGLVTPDKTTLIASTHRAYAVAEKEKPGDGVGDSVRGGRRARFRRPADHRLRHGEARGRGRYGDLGCDARRARGLGRAAVRAIGL